MPRGSDKAFGEAKSLSRMTKISSSGPSKEGDDGDDDDDLLLAAPLVDEAGEEDSRLILDARALSSTEGLRLTCLGGTEVIVVYLQHTVCSNDGVCCMGGLK